MALVVNKQNQTFIVAHKTATNKEVPFSSIVVGLQYD